MQPQTIVQSRWKLAGLLAIAIVFVAIGIWIISQPDRPDDVWKGWLCAAFFGLCLPVGLWGLVRPQVLQLDADGFSLTGGFVRRPGKILWTDIDHFFVYRGSRGVKLIGYNYVAGRAPTTRIVGVARALGAEGGLPTSWSVSPESLVERLNDYRARAVS